MGVLRHTLGALGTMGARSGRCVHSPGWDPRAVRRWGLPAGPLGELPEARRPPVAPSPETQSWGAEGPPTWARTEGNCLSTQWTLLRMRVAVGPQRSSSRSNATDESSTRVS